MNEHLGIRVPKAFYLAVGAAVAFHLAIIAIAIHFIARLW